MLTWNGAYQFFFILDLFPKQHSFFDANMYGKLGRHRLSDCIVFCSENNKFDEFVKGVRTNGLESK